MNLKLKRMAAVGASIIFSTGIAFADNTGLGNHNTGYKSHNNVDIEDETEVEVENDNNAHILNDVLALSNTGKNKANYNTGDEDEGSIDISTGNANAKAKIGNTLNRSKTNVSVQGDNGMEAMNSTTGAKSRNNVEIEKETKIEIENDNKACVTNDVSVIANTGKNKANGNTGSVSIDTGNATAEVEITNDINSNDTTVNVK